MTWRVTLKQRYRELARTVPQQYVSFRLLRTLHTHTSLPYVLYNHTSLLSFEQDTWVIVVIVTRRAPSTPVSCQISRPARQYRTRSRTSLWHYSCSSHVCHRGGQQHWTTGISLQKPSGSKGREVTAPSCGILVPRRKHRAVGYWCHGGSTELRDIGATAEVLPLFLIGIIAPLRCRLQCLQSQHRLDAKPPIASCSMQ